MKGHEEISQVKMFNPNCFFKVQVKYFYSRDFLMSFNLMIESGFILYSRLARLDL